MKHDCPVEIREAEGQEPQLYATILTEGRASNRLREVFTPNSVFWEPGGVGISIGHNGGTEVRAVPIRADNGEIKVTAPLTDNIRQAVQSGKSNMSIEFRALSERTTRSGIREVSSALIERAAITDNPAYDTTHVEIRTVKRRRLL